jgi:hypothetical protein
VSTSEAPAEVSLMAAFATYCVLSQSPTYGVHGALGLTGSVEVMNLEVVRFSVILAYSLIIVEKLGGEGRIK